MTMDTSAEDYDEPLRNAPWPPVAGYLEEDPPSGPLVWWLYRLGLFGGGVFVGVIIGACLLARHGSVGNEGWARFSTDWPSLGSAVVGAAPSAGPLLPPTPSSPVIAAAPPSPVPPHPPAPGAAALPRVPCAPATPTTPTIPTMDVMRLPLAPPAIPAAPARPLHVVLGRTKARPSKPRPHATAAESPEATPDKDEELQALDPETLSKTLSKALE